MKNKSVKIAQIVFKTCLIYFIIILISIVVVKIFAQSIGAVGMFLMFPALIVYVFSPFVLIVMIFSGIYWLVNRKNVGMVS